MSFLTAEWNDLILFNFEIDPNLLSKYIPKGTQLDLHEDKCYISLIGFMFEDVKIKGVKVPFHVNFEEVNLRFYVKRIENGILKRGAVFIKEIVPKPAITFVANLLYKEHYQTLPMKHSRTLDGESKFLKYSWKKSNFWNSIQAEIEKKSIEIPLLSHAEFITEHYFGYTKYNKHKTIEYEVTHPRWMQCMVKNYQIDVDFKSIYGQEFSFLQNRKPDSIIFAAGSKITIEGKKIIK